MSAIVGRILCCPLLNSKFPLVCIVGKQQKNHKPQSLNYCFFANQRVSFFAMPFLPYKGFALTGHVKTAKCDCLLSSRTGGSRRYLLWKHNNFATANTVNSLHDVPTYTNFLSTLHWHAFTNALH